ncbi:MAG: prepilin-type N-terminal cleavage/methylation domain-containing protein [Candidatus Omnitrophota bacterium]|nr:prepilin-type N-terminal cleavage/methylation domain-containing protein [Candidatus Omnitrophota bacterium]
MIKSKKGFSLVELLVAVSLFAVVMLSIYTSFGAGMSGYKDIEENIEISQAARQVLERMNLDLRNAFSYSGAEAKFSGTKSDISFLSLVDKFYNNGITQDYAMISYRLEGDRLMRLCRRNQEALKETSETEAEEIASGVEEISFVYGNILAIGQPLEWKDSWGGDPKVLPAAVKIKLILKNKIKQEFERTVYIPLAIYKPLAG